MHLEDSNIFQVIDTRDVAILRNALEPIMYKFISQILGDLSDETEKVLK